MPAIHGLFAIVRERQDGWRREADGDRRRRLRQPDAPPLPAPIAPDPAARGHALAFHGLRRRLGGASRA